MMSKSKLSAIEFLELVQYEYLKRKGKSTVDTYDFSLEGITKTFHNNPIAIKYFEEINGLLEEELNNTILITKYQDPLIYKLLSDIFKEINDVKDYVFEGIEIIAKESPIFGTVDFDMFSAEVCRSDCDDILILISSGLFTYANLISKIVVSALPLVGNDRNHNMFSTKSEDVFNNIKNNKNILTRFFDLMLACLYTNEPPRAKPYFINSEYDSFCQIVRHSFETFVVAHEYSHFMLGHLKDSHEKNIIKIDSSDIEHIYHNWNDELQADLYGAMLTLHIMRSKGYDLHLGMLGIVVCIKSLELFEKLSAMRANSEYDLNELSSTHPPAYIREKSIINTLFENEENELFSTISSVIDSFWDEFKKFYIIMQDFLEKSGIDLGEDEFYVIQDLMYEIISKYKIDFIS